MEESMLASTIRRMIFPSPTRCSCPITSEILRGRMRRAKLSGIKLLQIIGKHQVIHIVTIDEKSFFEAGFLGKS